MNRGFDREICAHPQTIFSLSPHPGGNPGANLKSISHRFHPILVAFVWELTKETIDLPLGCLQGGLWLWLAPRKRFWGSFAMGLGAWGVRVRFRMEGVR